MSERQTAEIKVVATGRTAEALRTQAWAIARLCFQATAGSVQVLRDPSPITVDELTYSSEGAVIGASFEQTWYFIGLLAP